MNERVKAITRLIVAVVLFVNGILTSKGINPIPFNETAFTEVLADVLSGAAIVWAWWKNNNVTQASQIAQNLLKDIKNGNWTTEYKGGEDECTK